MKGSARGCILVTGGAGFIGSAVVRQYLAETEATVVNLDKLTYAASPTSLAELADEPRHVLEEVDVTDAGELERVLRVHRPEAVIHLAAETHVDRSIGDAAAFVDTNVVGTQRLLTAAANYWQTLDAAAREAFRFLHVSTDEVYGDLAPDEAPCTESAPYAPSSPYAASKAAADHFVRAWYRTHGLPVLITNCSNNLGPRQFPEKLVPLMILRAQRGDVLPVYGNGEQVRDWLHVDDHAGALRRVLAAGRIGATYHVGARCERRNIDVVRSICDHVDALAPPLVQGGQTVARRSLTRYVTDRPGHDRRYALDASRLEQELGWTPRHRFETAMEATVRWYLDNPEWLTRVAGVSTEHGVGH